MTVQSGFKKFKIEKIILLKSKARAAQYFPKTHSKSEKRFWASFTWTNQVLQHFFSTYNFFHTESLYLRERNNNIFTHKLSEAKLGAYVNVSLYMFMSESIWKFDEFSITLQEIAWAKLILKKL